MTKKNKLLGMLAMVLVFGLMLIGCNLLGEEEFDSGIINGVWHHVDNDNQRTGSVITISNGRGILTSIGAEDVFAIYKDMGQVKIGDTVIRSISFKGEWDGLSGKKGTMHWTCDFYIPHAYDHNLSAPDATWNNSDTYITYKTAEDAGLFVYTSGTPDFGSGFRFRK